jgi:tetratricopeptide (TPR) repeat protein
MTPFYERANYLIDNGRFDLAVTELLSHLAEHPDDSRALSLLAFCHLRGKRYGEATEAAEAAITADPRESQGFYMMALVMRERNQAVAAMEAIQTALNLEPAEPDYLVTLAYLHMDARRWDEALAAAQLAIERSPQHVGAINAMATCLIRLRRVSEAAQALENALAYDPEDSRTLANMGWLELDRNRYGDALAFFQRALMLEPESEWAREGLMQALRARYPLYGLTLRYSLWMQKHSHKLQQQITLATYLGARLFRELLSRYPGLAVILAPLLVVWRIFCYATWTARAGSTLLLRCTSYGRALVNRHEVIESNLVGAFWLAALITWCYHTYIDPFTWLGKIGPPVFLTLPMIWAGTFDCHPGWPRKVGAGISATMTVVALLGLILLNIDLPTAAHCLRVYFYGFGPVLFLFQFLSQVDPKK